MGRKRKYTIEFVKREFERENWICVSEEYIEVHSRLNYICSKGHRGSITFARWRKGQRCPICVGNKKHTIDFIRFEFKKEGWTLTSTKYINSKTHLNYICSEGHRGSITWSNWKKGHRCPTCSGNKKFTIDFIKLDFEKEEYICVSNKYVNSTVHLKYICPKGHIGLITWSNWNRGKRCPTCAVIRNSGSGHYNWKGGISKEPYCQNWTDDLREYVKQRDGYRCLNPYCNSKSPDKLAVHHINYNKKSCGPENLITVCRSCNATANYNRPWHEAWYKAILYKRYGYKL